MTDEGEQQNAPDSTNPNEEVESEQRRVNFFFVHDSLRSDALISRVLDVVRRDWLSVKKIDFEGPVKKGRSRTFKPHGQPAPAYGASTAKSWPLPIPSIILAKPNHFAATI